MATPNECGGIATGQQPSCRHSMTLNSPSSLHFHLRHPRHLQLRAGYLSVRHRTCLGKTASYVGVEGIRRRRRAPLAGFTRTLSRTWLSRFCAILIRPAISSGANHVRGLIIPDYRRFPLARLCSKRSRSLVHASMDVSPPGERRWKCDQCPSAFARPDHLRRHSLIRMHDF